MNRLKDIGIVDKTELVALNHKDKFIFQEMKDNYQKNKKKFKKPKITKVLGSVLYLFT
jgi:hypothetical protein